MCQLGAALSWEVGWCAGGLRNLWALRGEFCDGSPKNGHGYRWIGHGFSVYSKAQRGSYQTMKSTIKKTFKQTIMAKSYQAMK